MTAKTPKDLARIRAAEGLASVEDLSILGDEADVDQLFKDDYLSEAEVSLDKCWVQFEPHRIFVESVICSISWDEILRRVHKVDVVWSRKGVTFVHLATFDIVVYLEVFLQFKLLFAEDSEALDRVGVRSFEELLRYADTNDDHKLALDEVTILDNARDVNLLQ